MAYLILLHKIFRSVPGMLAATFPDEHVGPSTLMMARFPSTPNGQPQRSTHISLEYFHETE